MFLTHHLILVFFFKWCFYIVDFFLNLMLLHLKSGHWRRTTKKRLFKCLFLCSSGAVLWIVCPCFSSRLNEMSVLMKFDSFCTVFVIIKSRKFLIWLFNKSKKSYMNNFLKSRIPFYNIMHDFIELQLQFAWRISCRITYVIRPH